MKQHVIYIAIAMLIVLTVGCNRDYKAVHVRVPIDTMAHNDMERIQESSIDALMDEPLIDIPDIPQESDFENVSSRDLKEFDDYMKGL